MAATSADVLQNQFHALVTSFVNGGCLTRADRMRALVSTGAVFRRNASAVCEAYRRVRGQAVDPSLPARVIQVDRYDGDNRLVRAMAQSLSDTQGWLRVYVHGSLATGEEIPYSDFDALVILGDEVFADDRKLAAVAHRLSDARKYMFRADPLQHHGWFVLNEADLGYYCEAYFPEALFQYSRALFDSSRQLTIRKRDSSFEMRKAFTDLAMACTETLAAGTFLRNAYLTKCVFSQFMLLPALYLQAKTAEGVYKKCSFDLARRDFTAEEWQCMERVSNLRMEWDVPMGWWRRRLLSVTGPLRNTIVKNASPPIPQRMRLQITPALIGEMMTLVQRMKAVEADGLPRH